MKIYNNEFNEIWNTGEVLMGWGKKKCKAGKTAGNCAFRYFGYVKKTEIRVMKELNHGKINTYERIGNRILFVLSVDGLSQKQKYPSISNRKPKRLEQFWLLY